MASTVENRRPTVRASLAIPTAGTAFLAVTLWITGVPVVTSLLLAVLVAWQALGGFLIWRAIRPESPSLELFGMGIAIGTAVAAISGLITSTAGLGPWGSLLPTAAVLITAYFQRETTKRAPAPTDRWALSAFLATVVVGLAVFFYALRSYPLKWTGSWTGYHPDMAFFEALANSLARFGAFESPFMSGASIRYHWLSYAWTGQLSIITDAAPFVGITRVLPLVSLVGSAAIVTAWTRRLSPNRWTPLLAGALLTVSGFVGAVFGGVLTLDSPSQAMSVLWLLAFALAVINALKGAQGWIGLTIIAVLGVAITLGKVSAAAPALAAVLLTVLVLSARKSIDHKLALSVSLTTLISIGAAFFVFLAGSSGGGGLTIGSLIDRASSQQGLNPLDGPRGVVLGTAILVLAVVPRWAGIFQLISDRSWRWRPETWMSIGLVGSSIAALVAFNSFNEIWFAVSVSGPLAATSAVGVALAVSALRSRGRPLASSILLSASVGALMVFGLVWWIWSSGASGGNVFVATQRWLGPLIAWTGAIVLGVVLAAMARKARSFPAIVAGTTIALVLVSVPGRLMGIGSSQIGVLDNGIRNEWFDVAGIDRVVTLDQSNTATWTDQQIDAAAALRAQAQPTDLIATNVTLGPLVAGLTHLPTYASAIVYQSDYAPGWVSAELVQRERLVWDFIDNPNKATAEILCTSNIQWVWIDKGRTEQRNWAPFASPSIQNDEVIVVKVNPDQC